MIYKIDLRLIDFDGCLANKNYLETCAPDKVNYENIITSNQDFIKHLTEEMREAKAQEYHMGSFSNRASLLYDVRNSVKEWKGNYIRTGSVYPALRRFTKEIQNEIKECNLYTYLMADLYGGKPDGESYTQAEKQHELWEMEATGDPNFFQDLTYQDSFSDHANWSFEEYKISMLYVYMHRAAIAAKKLRAEGKSPIVDLHIYDDRDDILKTLKDFYEINKNLRPKYISVTLYQYDGKDIVVYHKFRQNFKGEIDSSYAESVKDLIKRCHSENPNPALHLSAEDLAGFLHDRDARLKQNKKVDFQSPISTILASPYQTLHNDALNSVLMAGSNNNTMNPSENEMDSEVIANSLSGFSSSSVSKSSLKSILSRSAQSNSFNGIFDNVTNAVTSESLLEDDNNDLHLMVPERPEQGETVIAYDYSTPTSIPNLKPKVQIGSFEYELELFFQSIPSAKSISEECYQICVRLEAEIKRATLTQQEKQDTIHVMQTVRDVIATPYEMDCSKLQELASKLPGKTSYWQMVGGFLLALAGIALITSSVVIGVASQGFATPISFKGVTLGLGLMQQGLFAAGLVLGLGGLFGGNALVHNAEQKGISKWTAMFWKEAKHVKQGPGVQEQVDAPQEEQYSYVV